MNGHPTHELLLSYSLERTTKEEDAEIVSHVPECRYCQLRLEELKEYLEGEALGEGPLDGEFFGVAITALYGSFSHGDAAIALGYSKRSISRWERGLRPVSISTWIALDEILVNKIEELRAVRGELLARLGKETK